MTVDKETLDKLTSKLWRLNNLYWIRDKEGKLVKFKLNKAQMEVIKNHKHNKKIILKSRQRGISTAYCIYQLDSCIFKEGVQAGIQSYGKDEAEKLKMKIDLALREFPKEIWNMLGVEIARDNTGMIEFSNGSVIKIGNFRGDTLQMLHVSELGKIAKKYPDKAKELKTGAFQAVAVKNKITIESTAEGKTGLFYEMWNKAWTNHLAGVELSPLDFQPIFLSWIDDDDCWLETSKPITAEQKEYFDELEFKLNTDIPQQKRWWWVAKYDELGFDIYQEYPATPEEAFAQSVEGTYYKNQYQNILKEKRILTNLYDKKLPVYAVFDLGMNDTMVIGYFQVFNGIPRLIDEYTNNGENIEFYVRIIRKTGYKIPHIFLPHDANVKELGTGRTRIEEFRRLGVRCKLLKRQSLQDGINGCRQFLNVLHIDAKCTTSIDAIQNYRQKYDKRLEVFLDTPEHDEHSHAADMIRYASQGLTYNRVKETIQAPLPEDESQYSDEWEANEDDYEGFAV